MNAYVAAAYLVTVLLLGGFALSVVLRRRAVERALSDWQDEA
jgi:heme exporter protein CcmD